MESNNAQQAGSPKEGATANAGEGSVKEADSLIERATLTAERLERSMQQGKDLADRWEGMMAKAALGGKSEAGQRPKTKEEMEEEEVTKRLKAWGYKK